MPPLSGLLLLQAKQNARDEVSAQDEKHVHSGLEDGNMQGVVEENHEDGDAPQTIKLRYAFHGRLSEYNSPFHYQTLSLTNRSRRV